MINYHTCEFERDRDGAWALSIDRKPVPEAILFRPDKTYERFSHVGVQIPSDDICLDLLRLEGE